MTLTPFHLQVIGVVILVALGLATVWWIGRIVIGRLRGRALYLLPAVDPDADDINDDADDGNGDGSPGHAS